jgi:SanA protein
MLRARRLFKLSALAVLVFLAIVWWCDRQVTSATADLTHYTIGDLPHNHVGLVLGTSERTSKGWPNLYFQHRIAAAAQLYHAGKVDHLLVSGDNSRTNYNEPEQMRRALMAAGVDSAHITMDFAGFRTLDSVVRAREVFGTSSFTIISQRFHNERALFLAQQQGMQAVAFNAADVPNAYGRKTMIREKLARTKVYLDLILGTGPKFLGEPVLIGEVQE